jgi:predicted HTH domain antitoxin
MIPSVVIELPDVEINGLDLTAEQARLELAIGLYAGREVSLGRAARIAALPYDVFMREAARRGIPINYTEADALQDIETVRQRLGK